MFDNQIHITVPSNNQITIYPFAYVPTATKLVPQLPICLHVTRVALGDALLSCTRKLMKFAQETLGTCYIATYSFSNQSCQPQIHQPWFMKIRGVLLQESIHLIIQGWHENYLFTYLASSRSGDTFHSLSSIFFAHGMFFFITTNGCAYFFPNMFEEQPGWRLVHQEISGRFPGSSIFRSHHASQR